MPDLDLVDDPAANTADLLIDRADSCVIGPDDADVSHVAGIVTQTWQDATDLAHQVIEDPRFASTVRAIIDAENNGLDIAEPLAQVPRDTLAGSGGEGEIRGSRRARRSVGSRPAQSRLGSLPCRRPDLAPRRCGGRPPERVARIPSACSRRHWVLGSEALLNRRWRR